MYFVFFSKVVLCVIKLYIHNNVIIIVKHEKRRENQKEKLREVLKRYQSMLTNLPSETPLPIWLAFKHTAHINKQYYITLL